MRFFARSAQKCEFLLSRGHFVERTGAPRQCLLGTNTSEMNIEVRLNRGDQAIMGANSARNKRNVKNRHSTALNIQSGTT